MDVNNLINQFQINSKSISNHDSEIIFYKYWRMFLFQDPDGRLSIKTYYRKSV